MKISNETKVGILAALSITVLILGFNFLKGKELFKKTKSYYAVYPKVDGLKRSNFVSVNGYEVGIVGDVLLLPQDSFKLLVRIDVNPDIQIPANSKLKIINFDLFGNKAIEIQMGNETVYAQNGDTLIGTMESNLIASLSGIVSPLKDKLDIMMGHLNTLLGGESGENIQGIIENTRTLTENLAALSKRVDNFLTKEETDKLSRMLTNADDIVRNLRDQNQKVTEIMSNMDSISRDLAQADLKEAIDNANRSLAELNAALKGVNEGKGSLGKLANDEQLYNNLASSAGSLDRLLTDMQKNPKRYVHFSMFGKKANTPDPPKEEKK